MYPKLTWGILVFLPQNYGYFLELAYFYPLRLLNNTPIVAFSLVFTLKIRNNGAQMETNLVTFCNYFLATNLYIRLFSPVGRYEI